MSATEQLGVYDQYLERWNYNGSNELGIMQGKHLQTDLYQKSFTKSGSPAWKQNPCETNQWWRYNSRRYE